MRGKAAGGLPVQECDQTGRSGLESPCLGVWADLARKDKLRRFVEGRQAHPGLVPQPGGAFRELVEVQARVLREPPREGAALRKLAIVRHGRS